MMMPKLNRYSKYICRAAVSVHGVRREKAALSSGCTSHSATAPAGTTGAAFEKGDIVTAVDGKPIHSAAQLRNIIGLTSIGHHLRITFERAGASQVGAGNKTPGRYHTAGSPVVRPNTRVAQQESAICRIERNHQVNWNRGEAWDVGDTGVSWLV